MSEESSRESRRQQQEDMLDLLTPAVVRVYPDGLTLEECGMLIGVTRERVRQIEHSAMLKMRLLQRIKALAPAADAPAIIDGLRGAHIGEIRARVKRLKCSRVAEV